MCQRLPDKEPTSFELGILKWIFIPVVALLMLNMCSNVSRELKKCESICKEKGYYDARYKPSDRFGASPSACYCLTKEESKLENRYLNGEKIF